MSQPLHEAKAELFRNLGHPVRVRALELLLEGPRPVHELLAEIEVEPSNLSQQLAVLRRAGLVNSRREGSTVLYTLSSPEVAEMMDAARAVLTNVISGQQSLLAELASEAGS
ncbi:MAG: helix-turn-helix transcriptional regulator [Solirubrobacterales bacterium]|nr:helix-turn-helix transcriptional regulator [Solirubrobacterales bacterium]HRV59810.1 metalloregulator ArsR/SmtB family transcription factor [Solirubrobacterales bacterium]